MPENSQERKISFATEPSKYAKNVNRWAIIVGISKYKYEGLDLQYAHKDANELYELIRTPSGGAFEDKRIQKFINEEATTAKITGALRSFLKKPADEDIVLIFFACHGAPDPERTNVVYLLTHDTDPEDIAATALPMREIDAALKDNLRAERVVIIADSCHSAAVGGKIGRRGIDDSAVVNRYLQDLSESKPGLALLTSAQTNESSLEGEQWGGGHGVFTHFLLEGMRGKADRNPRNGTVSIGELFEYVRDEVKRETGDAQHPVIGSNGYDPLLPLAIPGGISSEEHLQLGICMNQLGRLLNEHSRFAFALSQLKDAIDTADRFSVKLPQAHLEMGLAETYIGDHEAAVLTLRQAINDDKDHKFPEAHFHLGMVLARLGKKKQAATALKQFMTLQPQDARSSFVEQFVTRLDGAGRNHVLLIGISNYKLDQLRLAGPENDLQMMKDLLIEHFGVSGNSIRELIDSEATLQAIVTELEQLILQANAEDRVLVYFSGHAFRGDEVKEYLLPYDYDEIKKTTLGAQQLHDLLKRIPSRLKTMIIDSHATHKIVELAESESRYRLILGTSPTQMAYEGQSKGLSVGAFTNVLVEQLALYPANAPLSRILKTVSKSTALLPSPQQPVFVGDLNTALLSEPGCTQDLLDAYDFSLRRNYDTLSLDEIRAGYEMASTQRVCFLQLYLSYGRAFLEMGQFAEALNVLEQTVGEYTEQESEAFLALGVAHLHIQNYEAALTNLQKYTCLNVDVQIDAAALGAVSELKGQRKHALLVGIDQYQAKEIKPLRGAVNDVDLVKKILIEKCNFADEDIKVLINNQAKQGSIDEAFNELLCKAQHGPALFYFAGYGSLDQNGEPTIVPVNSRLSQYPSDIPLRALAEKLTNTKTNLITIIDAGWQENVCLPYGGAWGSRFVSGQAGSYPTMRGIVSAALQKAHPEWKPDSDWNAQREQVCNLVSAFKIGRLAIYHISIQSVFGQQRGFGGEPVVEAEFTPELGSEKQIHGVLTHALMQALCDQDTPIRTYLEWAESATRRLKWLQPFVIGGNLAEAIFTAPVQEWEVHDKLYIRQRQEPIRRAIQLLKRLIEQAGGRHAFGNLNLGVAHAALGEYSESLAALERAIEESGDSPIPEAHYYLGRVLYEMNDKLDWAISHLRQATEEDPQNVSANYFFGHAVRKRMEQKMQVEATSAFEFYLSHGAPLGNREEVNDVLRRWSDSGKGTGSSR